MVLLGPCTPNLGCALAGYVCYETYISAYYRQIGAIWGVSVLGLLHVSGRPSALDYAAGLTVFIALTAYYTRAISRRLLEGIRLQLANALLATACGAAQG